MRKAARILSVIVLLLSMTVLAAEDITLESEVMKVVLHGQTGTYSLYRKSGTKDRFTAFNEVADNASSSFFAVKAGSRYFPLRRSYSTTVSTVQNEDGSASFVWDIGGMIQAEVRFTLLVTEKDSPADSVRIDLSVMNLTENEGPFAIKAVVDTLLGETSRIHFTTAKGTAILSEKAFDSMVQDKWLSSSDGIGTVSVLLAGSAATAPDYVLAANRDILLSDAWKPVVNEGRSFSKLQSPNNSALGIWYSEKRLKLFETARYTFFVTTAAEGNVPPNAVLLGIESEPDSELSESIVASASQIVEQAVGTEDDAPSASGGQKTVDAEYVQQLLDRIYVIEESDDPDPEEIKQLSAEIDALILDLAE